MVERGVLVTRTALGLALGLLSALLLCAGVDGARSVTVDGLPCDATTDIRQVFAAPFTSNIDAQNRMQCVQNIYLATNDPKGIFLGTYLVVTIRTNEKIQQGYFHNNSWVQIYMKNFADFYRQRVLQLLNHDPALPTPWQIAFSDISTHNLVVQSMMLGVNAHISYDLALAVAETGTSPDTFRKWEDNNLINKVLDEVYNEAISVINDHYTDALKNVSIYLGKLDDLLFAIYLRIARQGAWDAGRVLELTTPGGFAYKAMTRLLDVQVTLQAEVINAMHLDALMYQTLEVFEGPNKLQTFCSWLPQFC